MLGLAECTFVQPSCTWQRNPHLPTFVGADQWVCTDGDGTVLDYVAGLEGMGGNLYWDGSCTTHVHASMRRAGWAVVMANAQGEAVAM